MSEVAEDALSIFRINIFLIGVYVSLAAFLSRTNGDVTQLVDSYYTILGLFFWFGTISSSILSYRSSRLRSINDSNRIGPSQKQLVRNVASSGLGTLIVVVLLSMGLWEGTSGSSVPIQVPIMLFILSLGVLGLVQGTLQVSAKLLEIYAIVSSWASEYLVSKLGIDEFLNWLKSEIHQRAPNRLLQSQSVLSKWERED